MQALFRKKGVIAILETLDVFKAPVLEKTFLAEFQRRWNYSAYERSRDIVAEYGLVEFTLEDNEKVMSLAAKGREFLRLWREMQTLLGSEVSPN